MSFEDYLQTSASQIETFIATYLNKWVNDEVQTTSSKLTPITHEFIDSCMGGKRLRGSLVKLGYLIASGKDTPEIERAASAVEIFQTSILAHDDIIDLSQTRRGTLTLYRKLGGDHYGISQTIGLGDIGFFLSVKLIAESNLSDKVKNKALAEFSQMTINTGLGEVLDVFLSQKATEYEEDDVLTIHRLKTAYYTIIYPLKIGVILADGDKTLLKDIERFGENLGIAYQLQDDILGVFGDETLLGKSVTSDIEEGKNTLLIAESIKNADKEQLHYLEQHYGKGPIGPEQLEQIKKIFTSTGALDYSQNRSKQLVDQAKKVITQMSIKDEYKDLLLQMSDYIIERRK